MKLFSLWILCLRLTLSSCTTKSNLTHKSIIYENQTKLNGSDANGRDYAIVAQKNKAGLKFNGGAKGFETQAVEGMASAKDIFTDQQASANKVGSGGMAQAGDHRGTMRNNKEKDDNIVYLDGDSDSKLTARQMGGNKSFVAQSGDNNWELNPAFQSLTDGSGTIVRNGKTFNYQLIRQENGDAQAVLRDNSSSSFGKSAQYTCKAQSIGVSTCFDEFGRKIGEVRANNNGEVTITDKSGMPVITAKASKDKDGKPIVVVNNGLLIAQSDKQQDFNCPGVPTNSINISKPLNFKYANQKTTDGGVQYEWPACFEVGADILLKTGVEAKNLAFKWTVNVLPLGRLSCSDAASNLCSKGGDCFYCNLCDPNIASKAELLTNLVTNLCEAKGGNTFTVKATVCPPPEANQFYYCDQFKKSLGDVYWKKKGDLDVIFEIYNRRSDAEFKADWQDLLKRTALIASYKSDPNVYETIQSILAIPSADVVKQWYKIAKAEKIACHESVVSYTVSGTKIKTDFLLEAATIGGIFKKNQCRNDQAETD